MSRTFVDIEGINLRIYDAVRFASHLSMPYPGRVGSAPPAAKHVRLLSLLTQTTANVESLMRSPISALKYTLRKSAREDGIFSTFRARLREQKTLVSFKWDAESQTGSFVPMP